MFASGVVKLLHDDPSLPTVTISGFAAGDIIDLRTIAYDSSGTVNLTSANVLEITEGGSSYSLPIVPISNTTGMTATLYAWVDFAADGTFGPGEFATAVVPSGALVTTCFTQSTDAHFFFDAS